MTTSALLSDIRSATQVLQQTPDQAVQSSNKTVVADRKQLVAAAKDLIAAAEPPEDAIWSIVLGPAGHGALLTAFRMKVFENFANPAETKTAKQLAHETAAQPELMARIMRVLVGIGVFSEAAEDTYAHNPRSIKLLDPTVRDLMIGISATVTATMPKLPEYLASIGFRSPENPKSSLFHYANQTDKGIFEWLQTQPEQLGLFSAAMKASTALRRHSTMATISSQFPRKDDSTLLNGTHPAEQPVLLVDVGGGRGQIIEDVRKQRPDLKGRMIVQDLSQEIEGRATVEGVEPMSYNFFTPQPVKGAEVYFFRHVFHDWPDAASQEILRNTIPALIPGRSRIVIVDVVVPDTDCPTFASLMDVFMMFCAGTERTERQWRNLLGSVGLQVVGIRGPAPGSEIKDSCIEAVLRE
ncbi:MAG: hypothetical protein M1828_002372 [Chrysothrix sp. TS-e1954]|nr:MAG: hypothetical protein M1828_002372 [Chrysothrix sp. TS-e1954]